MKLLDGHLTPEASSSRGRSLTRVWIFALTLLAAAFLGWSAFQTLGPGTAGGERSRMTIQALPSAPGGEETMVFVGDLILDGRHARLQGVTRAGTWSETNEGTALSHYGSDDASLSFEAATACAILLTWNTGGVARLEQDGIRLRDIDLRAPGEGEQKITAEMPVRTASPWTLVVALAISFAVLLRLRPWDPRATGEGWLVFWLAGLHLLAWASQCIGTNADSGGYHRKLDAFVAGQPQYFPPGYMLLVSYLDLGWLVALVQHALAVLALVWIFRMLRPAVGLGLAWLGAVLAGASWSALFLPQAIMSENLAFFGMTGCLYFAFRSRAGNGLAAAAASGALMGVAVLSRVVPGPAVLPGLLLVHLLPFSRNGLARLAVTLATGAVIVVAPIGWFAWKNSTPELTTSAGLHLWNRVVTSQQALSEGGPATTKLQALLGGSDPRGRPHWEVKDVLAAKGLDYVQVEDLLGLVAKEAILAAPFAFVAFSFEQAWRLYVADAATSIPPWGEQREVIPDLESPPLFPLSGSAHRWRGFFEALHSATWLPLCWLSIAGIALAWFLRERSLLLALGLVAPCYLFATANVEYFLPRYNVAVIPFMVCSAMVPLALVVALTGRPRTRLAAGGSSRGSGPSEPTATPPA